MTQTMRAGLLNAGNTCYLNAVLQCLANYPKLTSFLDSDWSSDKPVTKELAQLFNEMQSNVLTGVSTIDLIRKLHLKVGTVIDLLQQNDAMEFLTILLDILITETGHPMTEPEFISNKVKGIDKLNTIACNNYYNTHKACVSDITKMFYGQNICQVLCTSCKRIEHQGDAFIGLDLSVHDANDDVHMSTVKLYDLIEKAYTSEDVCRTCDACKHTEGRKSIRIWDLPDVLFIHLKRYTADSRKIRTPVIAEDNLDLIKYSINTSKTRYRLTAIVCHTGSMTCGHYFSLIKNNDDWLRKDDNDPPVKVDNIHNYNMLCTIFMYVRS